MHLKAFTLKYIILSFFCLIFGCMHSQAVVPDTGPIFNDAIVPRVDIRIHPDSLLHMLLQENLRNDHEYPADFIWNDGVRSDTIQNVGFRLRGNTSRVVPKKSFKIKFNHFGSPKFYGLSDMNLNGEHNDPSLIRAKLTWDIFRMVGLEGSRSNHVRLYINGTYRGLYIHVEHTDNDYLRIRNKDTNGQLIKCNYGVDLVYRGDEISAYRQEVYEAANNKSAPDYSRLPEFLKILNTPSDPDFQCKLDAVFDVDDFLKRLAVEILTGHWDNPVYNKNNAYLYFNPSKGKWELLSYDVDNTYGIDWFGIDWSMRYLYSWAHPTDLRPIYKNILSVPVWRTRFGYYIKKYVEEIFNPAVLFPHIDRIRTTIAPYIHNDTYYSQNYGYTYQHFIDSYDKALGAHVPIGLKSYISNRAASALSQLQNTTIAPVFEYPDFSFDVQFIYTSFKVTSVNHPEIKMFYRFENSAWQENILKDDGIFPDLIAGDGLYRSAINYTSKVQFDYYFIGKDQQNRTTRWPVCQYFSELAGFDSVPSLKINEFMADNSKYPDDAGDFDDWIELYNADTETVWLGDKYLTDKSDNPRKWKMPDVWLDPGAFYLIWADEQKSQGVNHANFKLSKDGEFIGIYDSDENNYTAIDSFTFGLQQTNISSGRYPDGTGPVVRLDHVTPGYSNVLAATDDTDMIPFKVLPNPSGDILYLDHNLNEGKLIILDYTGRKIYREINTLASLREIDISKLPAGMYLMRITSSGKEFTVKFIKGL
jgi:hypothetical protein